MPTISAQLNGQPAEMNIDTSAPTPVVFYGSNCQIDIPVGVFYYVGPCSNGPVLAQMVIDQSNFTTGASGLILS